MLKVTILFAANIATAMKIATPEIYADAMDIVGCHAQVLVSCIQTNYSMRIKYWK